MTKPFSLPSIHLHDRFTFAIISTIDSPPREDAEPASLDILHPKSLEHQPVLSKATDKQAAPEANANVSGELFGSPKLAGDRQGGPETATRVPAPAAGDLALFAHDHLVDLVELGFSLRSRVRLPNVQPVLGGRRGK